MITNIILFLLLVVLILNLVVLYKVNDNVAVFWHNLEIALVTIVKELKR